MYREPDDEEFAAASKLLRLGTEADLVLAVGRIISSPGGGLQEAADNLLSFVGEFSATAKVAEGSALRDFFWIFDL